jgi:sugar lactone lactonase YvrE
MKSTKFTVTIILSQLILWACSKDNTTISGYQLKVAALSPNSGKTNTLVTISGVGFSLILDEDTVLFNGVPATIYKATDSTIQAYVPSATTTGPVTVIVRDQEATGPVFTFTGQTSNALIVTAVTPNHGKAGDTIIVSGSGFDPDKTKDSVYINNTLATVIAATPTFLTVIVPVGTSGNVYVYADSRFTRGAVFTYNAVGLSITALSLLEGRYGDTVLISGTGFSTDTLQDITTFNGIQARVVSATATQLTTIVPLAAGTGPVKVSNGNQTATGPTFTYLYNIQVSTFAGGSQGSADGIGTQAQFYHPEGICFDSSGNLIVADCFNNLIRMVSPSGNVTTIAGSGTGGFKDANGRQAEFWFPYGVTSTGNGNIVICDQYNSRIRQLSLVSNFQVTTLAGNGGQAYVDGPALQGSFVYPEISAYDSKGKLYVADNGSSLLRYVYQATITTELNGQNNTPVLLSILALAVDGSDNVIITDGGARVWMVSPAGQISILAGTSTRGYLDGPNLSANFSTPTGVALDYRGNILVADLGNFSIRQIGTDGNVTTIAGFGTSGYVDGDVSLALFQDPEQLAVDRQGNIYVSEPTYNRIRKITIQ